MPLSVEAAARAGIQVTVVAGQPFEGGSDFWNNITDESALLGKASIARVTTQSTPCGLYQVVTAKFGKPVVVSPGSIYWVVLQNPPAGTNSFQWNVSVAFDTSSTNAQFIVDSGGSRWLSYVPGTSAPSALRVLAVQK
jgi:hypothetical protein